MLFTKNDFETFIVERFPIGGSAQHAELALAPPDILIAKGGNDYQLRIRLIVYDDDGSIRDIKEQDVFVGSLDPSEERLGAFLEGFRAAFAKCDVDKLEVAMPHDLVHFDVLKQKKAMTAEAFQKALSTKRRLGPYQKP